MQCALCHYRAVWSAREEVSAEVVAAAGVVAAVVVVVEAVTTFSLEAAMASELELAK